MTTRRSFIQQASLLGAGALLSPSLASAKPFKKIGIQLYSLRQVINKDVSGVITKVAQYGYKDVETYSYSLKNKYFGLEPKAFSALLKNHGLVSSSGHYGMDQLLKDGNYDELKTYIDAAGTIGSTYVTMPYMNADVRSTSDQYKSIADKMNKAGEMCKAAGLKFAYHNHDFEFDKLSDGSVGYDILLKNTDPALVNFELDLYWAVRAGRDPLTLFAEHPGRFVMWHVKDMKKGDPKMQTEVGNGSINFSKIFAAAKQSGVKSFFMEQEDNYVPDLFGSVAQSARYIKRNLM